MSSSGGSPLATLREQLVIAALAIVTAFGCSEGDALKSTESGNAGEAGEGAKKVS